MTYEVSSFIKQMLHFNVKAFEAIKEVTNREVRSERDMEMVKQIAIQGAQNNDSLLRTLNNYMFFLEKTKDAKIKEELEWLAKLIALEDKRTEDGINRT
jgi:hypothetical protein